MRPLQEYNRKRDFKKTREPKAQLHKGKRRELIFVVQEHHASHLHYDFRLEWDGVLKSWAVPKGPSMNPSTKRLAVEVEDHPYDYAKFEGEIPAHEYGGGQVYIWDQGTWTPEGDAADGLSRGRLDFELKGDRLQGRFLLLRTRRGSGGKPQWLLIKRNDEFADHDASEQTDSVAPKLKTRKKASTASKQSATFVEPELALLVDEPPQGPDWIHETKFDGYRIQAQLHRNQVHLWTRTQQDWTAKYGPIVEALRDLSTSDTILDGEIVWADGENGFDFQKLQNTMKSQDLRNLRYYIFDLLRLEGQDLRDRPLHERKELLAKLLGTSKKGLVLNTPELKGGSDELFHNACDLQMEGLISKRRDSLYQSGRHDDWVKTKCKMRQEFVIGGFTEGEGARKGALGSLLLGVPEESGLRYVGRVGTGFDSATLKSLTQRLRKIEKKKTPFAGRTESIAGTHWVDPQLVCEIAFAQWTQKKILRVPVFQGIRSDKPASAIRFEEPVPLKKISKGSSVQKQSVSATSDADITHPEKIVFKSEGLRKIDVAHYYDRVAPLMMPFTSGRPLSLVRCPNGSEGVCFFQKHLDNERLSGVKAVKVREKAGIQKVVTIDSAEGFHSFVQRGTLEFHAWNSRSPQIEFPDQIVMDLDPGVGVPFAKVKSAALLLREMLTDLGMESYVKTTGGKGLHVCCPIRPIYKWPQIQQFCEDLAQELVDREPHLYLAQNSKKAREKKIFLDYLRNTRGATAVLPYSLRAKPQSSVAMPLEWAELEELTTAHEFSLEKALEKIDSRPRDPWENFYAHAQEIPLLDPA